MTNFQLNIYKHVRSMKNFYKPIIRWIPFYCTKWRVIATASFHSIISSTYSFYASIRYFLKYVDTSVMTFNQFFISLVPVVSGVKTWMTSCQIITELYISVHTVPISQKERRISILSIKSRCSMCKINIINILIYISSQLDVLTGIS
jgi:hypothetical protein